MLDVPFALPRMRNYVIPTIETTFVDLGLRNKCRSVKFNESCKDLHFQLALSYILLLPLAALPHAPVRDSRKKELAGQARNYPLEPERTKIQRMNTVSFLERNVFYLSSTQCSTAFAIRPCDSITVFMTQVEKEIVS